MIIELRNLKRGQRFKFKEINGKVVTDQTVYEYIKVACGWWIVFGKPNNKKKYRDLWQWTMNDQIKVEVIPEQGQLFNTNIYSKPKIK